MPRLYAARVSEPSSHTNPAFLPERVRGTVQMIFSPDDRRVIAHCDVPSSIVGLEPIKFYT